MTNGESVSNAQRTRRKILRLWTTTDERRQRMAKSLSPIHPGEILLEDFMKPLGLKQYHLAQDLGQSPYGPRLGTRTAQAKRSRCSFTENCRTKARCLYAVVIDRWCSKSKTLAERVFCRDGGSYDLPSFRFHTLTWNLDSYFRDRKSYDFLSLRLISAGKNENDPCIMASV